MLFHRKTGSVLVILAFVLLGLLLVGSDCGTTDDHAWKLKGIADYDPTPVWWTDGSRIAVAMPPEGIYIVDAQGSDALIFPPGSPVGNCLDQGNFSPALSPDGSRLAYVVAKRDGRSEIVTSAIDGSDVRRLTRDKGLHAYPTWSPDGTQIAFMSGRDLRVMDADGSNVRTIAATNYAVAHPPAWSPDGSRIAFVGRDYSLAHTIRTVRPDGSDLVELGETVGDPVWSPDGSRLAFIAENLERTRDTDPGLRIYVMDPDGSDQRQWTSYGDLSRWHTAMSWSPDGSKIVYGAARDFVIVSADGTGTPVAVWEEDGRDRKTTGGAAWSPDGSTIAFYSNRVLFTTAHDGSGRRILARVAGGPETWGRGGVYCTYE